MIALIPTRSADVTSIKNALDSSVGNTISLYKHSRKRRVFNLSGINVNDAENMLIMHN